MKILFINPNLRPGHPTRYLPVGLAYVMTVVAEAGHELELLDIGLGDQSDDEIEHFLASGRWDAVLTGSIVTHYKWMKWLTKAVRRHQPEARIIVGNSVAGSIPELFLAHSEADAVVVGEGEYAARELLACLEEGGDPGAVPGLVLRSADGRPLVTPRRRVVPIDSIPRPDWELFDVEGYFAVTDAASAYGTSEDERSRTMPVATARGCVFKCTFCHIVYKHDPYRHRAAAPILEEVEHGIERYGANYINFWDDLTFYKLAQAEKLVDAILASPVRFRWSAAVRTDLFGNPRIPYEKRLEVAHKFRDSGCVALGYSLESGSEAILEQMQKRVKVEYFEEQVRILREVGIASNTSVVLGYPIETPETIRQTFALCERNAIYPSVGFLLPLPDTEMYDYAREHGFIPDENAYLDSITERQDICINMTEMPDAQILELIQEGCGRLSEQLGLGLDKDRYIRTGGYRKHSKTGKKEKPRRHQGDTSFSYSRQVFDLNG